jgi:hypothetical protein
VLGEDAEFPDALADLVVPLGPDEESPQPLRGDVDLDVVQVDAGPGLFQGGVVQVGREDLVFCLSRNWKNRPAGLV